MRFLKFVDFTVLRTVFHNDKTISKTQMKKDQENSAHCFGSDQPDKHLIKFLQGRIKTWRVRVRTGYQFFQEKSLVRVLVLPIKDGIVDKYYFSRLTYFFGATKNPSVFNGQYEDG